MVVNKKGQVTFYVLMLGVVLVILALALTPVVKNFTDDAMSSSSNTALGLDCTNSSISNYVKAQCVVVDLATPYFFFALLGLVGVVWGAKQILT